MHVKDYGFRVRSAIHELIKEISVEAILTYLTVI